MRSRDKRSSVAWALLLLVLLLTSVGDIVANPGDTDSQSTRNLSNGGAPDTLFGGPGGTNHGDPDDFDFVSPVGLWIHGLLTAFSH